MVTVRPMGFEKKRKRRKRKVDLEGYDGVEVIRKLCSVQRNPRESQEFASRIGLEGAEVLAVEYPSKTYV